MVTGRWIASARRANSARVTSGPNPSPCTQEECARRSAPAGALSWRPRRSGAGGRAAGAAGAGSSSSSSSSSSPWPAALADIALNERRTGRSHAALELEAAELPGLCAQLDGWAVATDARGRQVLERKFKVKNFPAGLELFERIKPVAEASGHHPDLHLEDWNRATLMLTTHDIGGRLSLNDFIVAARLDLVEVGDLLWQKKTEPAPELAWKQAKEPPLAR